VNINIDYTKQEIMKPSSLKFLFLTLLLFLLNSSAKNEETIRMIPKQGNYSMLMEKDVKIQLRNGSYLSSNIYRPDAEGKFPVIMSLGPYGKDNLPHEYDSIKDGTIHVSEYAAFETPDPDFWVKYGYIIIAVDSRGTGKSPGKLNLFEDSEAKDYYDAIRWAGSQSWSSGKVGLNGVSYYGMSQWKVAAMKPYHLKAIIVWEGFTDMYRDGAYHRGIPNSFIDKWFNYRILTNLSPENTGYRDLPNEINNNQLSTAQIYQDLGVMDILHKIEIPAYISVSIQDHGMHTRGTIKGFERISSTKKWLELHGRKKWEYYYSEDALSRQKMFFDQFLKEENSGILNQPPVRYELRESYYNGIVKSANTWPVPNRTFKKLYLNASRMTLENIPQTSEVSFTSYTTIIGESALITKQQRATFRYTFEEKADIIGSIKLNAFVSTDGANDIDLFVGIQKEDANGNDIYFEGPGGAKGQVASGWLRVSHRALDVSQSSIEIPYHLHDRIEKIPANEIVEVQVEIWPTTTRFDKGEQLVLIIQGSDIEESHERHKGVLNHGNTTIHTGGANESYLQIPIL
jgi:predicted acyl esterase